MEEREISIKELIQVVWNGKFMIIILAAAFMFVGFTVAFVKDKTSSQVSTVLALQWSGVSEGEYPDGTRFDYNTAIESYVYTLALEEQGITTLNNDSVRGAMNIVPIVPSNIASVIETALINGEQISYYPTNYKVTLDNGGLDLSVDEGRDLLVELIDQFRIDFEKKFIQQSVILDFTETDFTEFDYMDIHSMLETQIELIDGAMTKIDLDDETLTKRVELDPGFVSPTLGIGFADILVRTSLVTQLELSQISSRVTTYLLTKDVEYLITNYSYQIDLKQLELDKALVNVADTQVMVDNYTGSVNTIIIPGMEPDIEIDTYYNVLIESLVTLKQQVSELENDITYIELQIDRLNGDDPSFNVTPVKLAEEIVKVEDSILSADIALTSIIEDANKMLVEYNIYTTSNVIKPLMTPSYESSVSTLLYTGIALIIGAGIGVVVVLFKHDWE